MHHHRLVFVGGLHHSGTSLLARYLGQHPSIAALRNTGVTEDEGERLQTVYPSAQSLGGPGQFGFDPKAHLTEESELVSDENRARLMAEWGRHWDFGKPMLVEQSPSNLLKMRFLQALFSDSRFVVVIRNPIPVTWKTHKLSRIEIDPAMEHWALCH